MKTKSVNFNSPLAEAIQRFLSCHRALGKRFNSEESSLRLLDRYLDEHKINSISSITQAVLDSFLISRRRNNRSYNLLLNVISRFFYWMVAQQLLVSSPLNNKPRRVAERYIPFIFEPLQVKTLLDAASQLPDYYNSNHRGDIYATIFMLMYCLGLRVSEANGLYRKDVDMVHRYLIIRETKFVKSRLVPFGPKLSERLHGYLVRRSELQPDHLLFSFSSDHLTLITRQTISRTFQHLLSKLDLKLPPGVTRVRLHSLRHSFAVGTLLRWYRQGQDPTQHLIYLSAFLGHVNPESTAVYLTATGDLLEQAGQRFQYFVMPLLEEGHHEHR